MKLYLVSKYMSSTNSYFHFGSVAPCYPFVFRRRPYIVRVFQGFAFLLHVISSSFFTREYWNHTISFTNSATKPMLQKHVWTLQVHTVQSFVLCVVSFHFMVLYTIQLLKNLVLHFLPPPLDSRLLFSPCRSFPSFSSPLEIPFHNLFTVGGLMSSKLPPAVSCVV